MAILRFIKSGFEKGRIADRPFRLSIKSFPHSLPGARVECRRDSVNSTCR